MKSVWKICLLFLCAAFIIVILLLFVMRGLNRNADGNDEASRDDQSLGNAEEVVTEETLLMISSFDINEEEEVVEEGVLPEDLIGRTRSGITAYYEAYLATPDETDLEKGLTDIEIISFNGQKLIIRKIYDATLVQQETTSPEVAGLTEEDMIFYVKNVDEKIAIFYPDENTLYFETGILMDGLPFELIREIENGKVIRSVEELYNFLESYTS